MGIQEEEEEEENELWYGRKGWKNMSRRGKKYVPTIKLCGENIEM